jgi:hypothetical protein
MIERANKEYLESHKKSAIRVEADETWSFYRDKGHQIRLWRAVGRESGEGKSLLVWGRGT